MDVGHVSTADAAYHFLNIVHMGFSVEANRSALKLKFLGNSAYTLATLWQVVKLGSFPLELEIDGGGKVGGDLLTRSGNRLVSNDLDPYVVRADRHATDVERTRIDQS